MSLVELLNPKENEHILDLGCGDGKLTTKIAIKEKAARVVGIDHSKSFSDEWDKARRAYGDLEFHGDVEFHVMDAASLNFNEEFDAVFSNFVIHHIKPPEQVISSVWNALKPGGRFVAEFYGHGTAKEIILALQEVMSSHNYSFDINEDFPWYLPTQEKYCNLLINQGFEGTAQSIFPPEKRPFPGNIVDWLHQVINTNTQNFDDNIKEQIFPKVQDQVSCQLFEDSTWFVNYQHIRIVARKSSQLSNNN